MKQFITMDNTFNFLKKPWVIFLTLIIIFFLFKNVDRTLALYFHQLNLRSSMRIISLFSFLGLWIIYVVLFAIAGFYFHFISKNLDYAKNAWYLFACVVIPNLLGLILKICLGRARPELLFSHNLYGFYWFKLDGLFWSLPSGHALTITGLAAGLGKMIPGFYTLFIFVALLVAGSRVVLYHHYLSDILVGFYLGIMSVGLFTNYIKPKSYKKDSK